MPVESDSNMRNPSGIVERAIPRWCGAPAMTPHPRLGLVHTRNTFGRQAPFRAASIDWNQRYESFGVRASVS